MLTIGDFARATGLTAKALRLYDDLDLLPPAEVDPVTGYRYYRPEQVEPARLVARLRSAGVPLATIAVITESSAEGAVAALLSYWRRVEADTASARTVVASLVADLQRQEEPMTTTTTPPRSAHRSGQGARSAQLDDLFPTTPRMAGQLLGQRLFAVADGFGDGVGVATATLDALEGLDGVVPGPDPLGALDTAVTAAADAVVAGIDGSGGTTLTALLLADGRAFVAHVGDSRGYLLRGGRIERLTRDHTAVQSMVDEGLLTDEEALADPRRALLNRAIAPGAPSDPDLSVRLVVPGDRYVLTTDGVHAVLDPAALAELLVAGGDPEAVAGAVEDAVLAAGAPDNYAIIVVDL